MALASPIKNIDLEHLTTLADVLEIGYRQFLLTKNEQIKQQLNVIADGYQQLKNKIETYDYTSDDAQYYKNMATYKAIKLSPDSNKTGL